MKAELIKLVEKEDVNPNKKWGSVVGVNPLILLGAITESLGELAHAISWGESKERINYEIVITMEVLSRLYNMVNK